MGDARKVTGNMSHMRLLDTEVRVTAAHVTCGTYYFVNWDTQNYKINRIPF